MNKYVLGRVVPIYRGGWEYETVYSQLDIVEYNGSSYVSLRDLNANKQPDTHGEYWGLMARAGEISNITWAEWSN